MVDCQFLMFYKHGTHQSNFVMDIVYKCRKSIAAVHDNLVGNKEVNCSLDLTT